MGLFGLFKKKAEPKSDNLINQTFSDDVKAKKSEPALSDLIKQTISGDVKAANELIAIGRFTIAESMLGVLYEDSPNGQVKRVISEIAKKCKHGSPNTCPTYNGTACAFGWPCPFRDKLMWYPACPHMTGKFFQEDSFGFSFFIEGPWCG